MKENKTTANILAAIGAVLWCVQLFPQLVKSYREKATHGLSPWLMVIWGSSAMLFSSYVVVQHLWIPLQIQPHIAEFCVSVSVAQCLYYDKKWSRARALALWGAWILFWAGFETGSVYGLKAGQRNGTVVPIEVYGYMSSGLSVLGVLPQYYEIYRLHEVRGLSLLFVATNVIGATFSMASLFFKPFLDVSAFCLYCVTASMVLLVLILAAILNPRANKRPRLAMAGAEVESLGREESSGEKALDEVVPGIQPKDQILELRV